MEQFVDRNVLVLALESSANGRPLGVGYDHIVRVLLQYLRETLRPGRTCSPSQRRNRSRSKETRSLSEIHVDESLRVGRKEGWLSNRLGCIDIYAPDRPMTSKCSHEQTF
jgi:hypothetical protein